MATVEAREDGAGGRPVGEMNVEGMDGEVAREAARLDGALRAPGLAGETLRRLTVALQGALGAHAVLTRREDTLSYGYDGSFLEGRADLVVLPESAEQVAEAIRLIARAGAPIVPRGAGTGLCGGAVPARGGVTLATTRMRRIVRVDARNLRAAVEPGVANLALSQAVAPLGLFYAPDPASQRVSTIGGNVATNAGGPHCLARGVTTNHVLAAQVALLSGELVWLGGGPDGTLDAPGFDLLGTLVGSEGTLGVVTQVVVRLMRQPEAVETLLAVYPDIATGAETVSAIIGAGIVPSALEMMDGMICRAVERYFHAGYPVDAGSVLLIELDGARETVEAQREEAQRLCGGYGARETRLARTAGERAALWAGRKGAAGALGQLAPSYYLQDVVVPRSQLPQMMEQVGAIGRAHAVTIPNLFHAGDGNLHPAMLFDRRRAGDIERVIAAGTELLRACVAMGGAVSGEHGIGMEKREALRMVFSAHELATMAHLRETFDPRELFNPEKLFPAGYSCAEARGAEATAETVGASVERALEAADANGAAGAWFC